MRRFVFLLLILAAPCLAADPSILPDKPQPQPSGKIRNAEDREFWIEAGALSSAWTLDAISTHQGMVANPRAHEVGLLFPGSRDTVKIMGAWAAVDVAAAVVSYEWKNHVRNRFLHPLWRVPLLVGTVGHDYSAVGNWSSIGKGSGPMETVTNSLPDSNTGSDPRVRQIGLEPLRVPRKIPR